MTTTTELKNGWVVDHDGIKHHYVNDLLHNDGGPAWISPKGIQVYFQHGKTHREDGPAYIEDNEQNEYAEYWLFGIHVEEEHLALMGLDDYPSNGFSKDQVTRFMLLCMK